MIQRIQSLYLLLAAGGGAAALFYNLWKARLSNGTETYVNASSNYLLFVLYIIIVLLAGICIFLFKKRKVQFRLTIFNILFTVAALAYQYYVVQQTANKLSTGGVSIVSASYLLASFLPIIIIILLFLAARGIYKDEKLIKSLDRLR
jgi:membrane protease YdiL (CAAX protease family)